MSKADTRPAPGSAADDEGLQPYHLDIHVLEDLHTGTGQNRGPVDSAQCTDRDGMPMLPLTVLHGQLRDTCQHLETKGLGIEGGRTAALFGRSPFRTEGSEQPSGTVALRRLHLGSAYLVDSLPRRWLVEWTASAREAGDRRPMNDTLRTAEYIRAGASLRAVCYLTPADEADLRKLLRARTALGAETTRGSGRVRMTLSRASRERPTGPDRPATASNLLLVLEALEPLAFTQDSNADNILPTRSDVPGQAIHGALVSDAISRNDATFAEALLAGEINCGAAYQLPDMWRWLEPQDLLNMTQSVVVRPALLSRQKIKGADLPGFPAWTGQTGISGQHSASAIVDLLDAEPDQENDNRPTLKRLGDQHLELRREAGDAWQTYAPTVRGRQRIQKPSQDLFTVLEIPERTRFVAEMELSAASPGNIASLMQRLGSGMPLLVGRGHRPLKVMGWHWRTKPDIGQQSLTGRLHLRISLASDLILRGPQLGFVQQWDLDALRWMLEDAGVAVPDLSGLQSSQVFDLCVVRGYNVMSRLPRMAQPALARGSTLVLDARNLDADAARRKLGDLVTALDSRAAWGERTVEGHGRLHLEWETLDVVDGVERKQKRAVSGKATEAPGRSLDEQLAGHALQLVESIPEQQWPRRRRTLQRLARIARALGDPSSADIWTDLEGCRDLQLAFQAHAVLALPASERAQLLYFVCRWMLASSSLESDA